MKNRYLFLLVLASMVLTGCSSLLAPIEEPAHSTYELNPQQVDVPKASPSEDVLLVTLPTASSGYASSHMAYVTKPYEINYYSRNSWVAPPSEMLLPIMSGTIQKTEHFSAVVASPYTGISNFRLDTHLLWMRQNFISQPSQLEFAMRAQLLNSDTQKIVASKEFIITVPLSDNTPYAGVLAANQVVANYVKQLSHFVIANS